MRHLEKSLILCGFEGLFVLFSSKIFKRKHAKKCSKSYKKHREEKS